MRWNSEHTVLETVTAAMQETNIAKLDMESYRYRCLTCSKHFSCKAGWKEHYSTQNTYCKCDVFEDKKYKHTITANSGAKFKRNFRDGELEDLEAEIALTYLNEPVLEVLPKKPKSELEANREA
jgi:hypothetical protein